MFGLVLYTFPFSSIKVPHNSPRKYVNELKKNQKQKQTHTHTQARTHVERKQYIMGKYIHYHLRNGYVVTIIKFVTTTVEFL